MKEDITELLEAIIYDLKEKVNKFDKFTDEPYQQGIIDGINICMGAIDKYM